MTFLDDIQHGGPRRISNPARPVFSKNSLGQLVGGGGIGFYPTSGFHVYCELRPTSRLEVAEDDQRALKYLKLIEDYVNHGVDAANPFGAVLLEAQGNVLHFYQESSLSRDSIIGVIQFAYLFTSTLYEELKPDLGEEWDGFATCVDHGDAIIVRHDTFTTSSAVSLGPAANEPAKQLLVGKTAAGCVEVPGHWARFLGQSCSSKWHSINLRNHAALPLWDQIKSASLRQQLTAIFRAHRQKADRSRFSSVGTFDNRGMKEGSVMDLSAPKRVQAFCVRADLDGFSAAVREAFAAGPEAVEKVALGFASILEFGQHMEKTTPGCIRLPWAGDCATTLIPDTYGTMSVTFPAWLDFAIRWQNYDGQNQEAKKRGWAQVFERVQWAIGGCHGKAGTSLVADIEAQGRKFRIAAGWPVSISLDAQNQGKGGDTVTHNLDYHVLDPITRRFFEKVQNSDFWKSQAITREKLSQGAVEAARVNTPKAIDYAAKFPAIQTPHPRPYYKDGQVG